MTLKPVLERADIWRGREHRLHQKGHGSAVRVIPTGYKALDRQLTQGGWPLGALTEVLSDRCGIGELLMFIPALARLSCERRCLAWVAPPHLPYAPALDALGIDLSRLILIRPTLPKEGFWAMEQTLRSGACGAVLAWPARLGMRELRRLQLAAETGNALGVLFRPEQAAAEASPSALRLRLHSAENTVTVQIIKRRGGWGAQPIVLTRDAVA